MKAYPLIESPWGIPANMEKKSLRSLPTVTHERLFESQVRMASINWGGNLKKINVSIILE